MSTISLLERYGRAPSGAHVSCLVCRACGHETPVEATNICERCFGPLEVRYDYEEVARRISRESIAAGPPSIWRYRDLLPVDLDETEPITLGAEVFGPDGYRHQIPGFSPRIPRHFSGSGGSALPGLQPVLL